MTLTLTNSDCWGLKNVVDFFDNHRHTTEEVYQSEWFFLKGLLFEGMTILDVGCAQGGFAGVVGEHLQNFQYTGVDINPVMIDKAKQRHSKHQFYCVPEADLSLLQQQTYDLVIVLGILHLHEKWRETLKQAWAHTKKTILFDLRESCEPSIEDKSQAYFTMEMNNGGKNSAAILPYNIINTSEALQTAKVSCADHQVLKRYGYLHQPSEHSVTPIKDVMASVYCIQR